MLQDNLEKVQSIPNKQETANKLLEHLSSKRKAAWKETVENTDIEQSRLKVELPLTS